MLVEVLLVSTRSGIPLELVKFNLIQAEVLCDKERTGNPPPGVSTDTSAAPLFSRKRTLHSTAPSDAPQQ